MGNNGSTSPGANDSSSSPKASSSGGGDGGRRSWSTSRTHSLPLGHHYQSHHRHRHHQQHNQYVHHTHSDRRGVGGTPLSPVVSSTPSRRSSSRFRQALPNLVNNVSAAIGHKLPWTSSTSGLASSSTSSASKRRFQKSLPSSNVAEKRSRSKTREHCRLFRELVSDWRLSDLHCLVVEFEAAAALRELRRRNDATRPQAATLKVNIFFNLMIFILGRALNAIWRFRKILLVCSAKFMWNTTTIHPRTPF